MLFFFTAEDEYEALHLNQDTLNTSLERYYENESLPLPTDKTVWNLKNSLATNGTLHDRKNDTYSRKKQVSSKLPFRFSIFLNLIFFFLLNKKFGKERVYQI